MNEDNKGINRLLAKIKQKQSPDEKIEMQLAKCIACLKIQRDSLLAIIEAQNVIIKDKLGAYLDMHKSFNPDTAAPLPSANDSLQYKLTQAFELNFGPFYDGKYFELEVFLPKKVFNLYKVFGEYLDEYWPNAEYAEGHETEIADNSDLLSLINETYGSPELTNVQTDIIEVAETQTKISRIDAFMELDKDVQKEIVARDFAEL